MKPKPINVHDAKTHLSRLLDRAHAGEEIVLSKAGKPYARLVPVEGAGGRRPGALGHLTMTDEFFEPLPADELDAWEGRGG